MKRYSATKVITRVIIVIMSVFMIMAVLRFFTRQVLVERMHINNAIVQLICFDCKNLLEYYTDPAEVSKTAKDADGVSSIDIDWAQLYPFDTTTNIVSPASSDETMNNNLKSIKNMITQFESSIEKYTTDYVMLYKGMLEGANAYDSILGWEINALNEYNSVITLSDGYLTSYNELLDITDISTSINSFNGFLADLDIPLLYVQAPSKVCEEDDGVYGVLDYSNQNADSLLTKINGMGVDNLDLRDAIRAEKLNYHSLFYKTDHHWKAETGLWATGAICNYLNDKYNFSIDTNIYGAENYDYNIYKNWFLGSQGKKVTLARIKPEDITLINPKFDVSLSIEIPSKGVSKSGDFSIMYQYGNIKEIDYYNKNPYAAYLYGDNALTIVHNNRLNDDKTVLIIGDSFENSVTPFISLGIENVEAIDLRHFTGSLREYIKQGNYDIVIIVYNAGMIRNFDYTTHTSPWDFR